MPTVGLIGAGNIGSTVARLAVSAGYDAVLSNSRGPQTLSELIDKLGPKARAATPEEAAESGDPVVLAVPVKAYRTLPAESLVGKAVIDAGNYSPSRDGHFPELDDESTTSSELLQRQLPGAQVVKCFNNIFFRHLGALARPPGSSERSALPIAGDDARAKSVVAAFLDTIGYDAVDAGRLANGRYFQPGTALSGTIYAGGEEDFSSSPGIPAGTEVVRRLLAAGV